MRIAFFEDDRVGQLTPLVWLRPVFELLCGQFSIRERLIRSLNVTEWGAFLRNYLASIYREQHPEAHVNSVDWLADGPTLLLNGRWLCSPAALADIEPDSVGILDGEIVWITVEPLEALLLQSLEIHDAVAQIAHSRKLRKAAPGLLIKHPWNLVEQNPRQLVEDFALRFQNWCPFTPGPHVAVQGPLERVFVDPAAEIDPFVVMDARQGPVSVEAGAVVQSFTRLEGPCHIGRDTQLFRAHVRGGTTIGPVCRVGGEVEASIIHGYSNKYHEGFLGHSYVCSWVNLGAQTNNSDLKVDYSAVHVPHQGALIDTGLKKVGCYIGDHSKTGLGSLFNTGSSVGVMSLVLPRGELLPRFIPSFTSVWHGTVSAGLPMDRLLTAARVAMNRRGCELSRAEELCLHHVFQLTQAERDAVIAGSRRERSTAPSSA